MIINSSVFIFHTGTVIRARHTLLLAAPTATTAKCVCCGGITTASFLASAWASVTTATS